MKAPSITGSEFYAQSLRSCLLPFLPNLPRDFLVASHFPRVAFGFKRHGVFQPSLTRGYNIGRSDWSLM